MIVITVLIVFAAAVAILSVLLFLGKCSGLIAGYNMLPEKEKAKYDKRKLCRGTGFVCLVTSIMLLIMAYLGYKVETGSMDESGMLPFAIIFILVIFIAVGANIYYTSKKCKKS